MLWGSPSRIFPTPGDATPKRATIFRSGWLEAEGLPSLPKFGHFGGVQAWPYSDLTWFWSWFIARYQSICQIATPVTRIDWLSCKVFSPGSQESPVVPTCVPLRWWNAQGGWSLSHDCWSQGWEKSLLKLMIYIYIGYIRWYIYIERERDIYIYIIYRYI